MSGVPDADGNTVDFIEGVFLSGFAGLKKSLGDDYPRIFLILGNDDLRSEEARLEAGAEAGLWEYAHQRRLALDDFTVYGYSFVPPTPFRLKDWERYDVSRYVDPGCTHPDEGMHSVAVSSSELKYSTIDGDLRILTAGQDLSRGIFLIHTPPYRTNLDRAALDGKMVDHVPLDLHVGSIAVKRFIEERQPLMTLHGHIHESARITGTWKDRIGKTYAFSAAHDGPELALVSFLPDDPETATRELL